MPWQVPITVDGLEYPVTFNTEEQPTQQDLDEAVQQILSQRGQALQPAQPAGETPGYLSQLGSALGLGYRQMKSGVGATFNALTGDTEDVAAEMAEQAKLQREQQAAQTPQDIEFMRRLDEAEKAYELARGPVETISALSQYPAAAFAEPGAAFKTAVQSAPNVLISGATSLAGYGLGGLVGGAAGIETGPGAILTGIAGAAAGGALSNTLMEAGPSIFDALNEKTNGAAANMTAEQISAFLKANPDVIEQGLKTGAIRGSVIGAVEALGVKGSGRLLTMPERAAARAAQKTLIDAGVDVTSKKAVDAALLDPTIRSATKTAAEAAKNQFSSAGNLARIAGASAIETGAAGAGELAAQAAAGQDISTKEAFMEMLGEAALSAPMAAATKAVEGAKYALTPSQEAEQPEVTQAEPTVVPTAEEPPSMISPEIAIAKNAIAATQNVPFTDITGQAATNIVQENARIASQLAVSTEQKTEEAGAEVTPSPDQLATVEEPWRIKGREWVKKQQANLGKWASDLDRSMNQNVDSVISSGQSFFGDFVDKDGNIDDGKLSAYREIFRSKGKDLILEKPIGNLDKWKKSGVKNFPVVDFAQPQTPSPAMEMPSPPQGVDMASASVSPIITEAPLSEGAERNRAVIAEAAAKLRGEAPQDISAGLQAAIPQQPVETQEDAVQEQIPDEGVLRQERPEMELQGVGEGNVQPEEVAETSARKQKPIKIGGTSPRAQSAAQEIRSLVGDETELRGQVVTAQGVKVKLLPFGESVRVSEIEVPSDLRGQGLASEALEQITSEADRLGVPLTLSAEPFGQKGLSKEDLESWYARKGFVPSGKQGILVREPQQPPSPTKGTEPTNATEGMVTPGGVASPGVKAATEAKLSLNTDEFRRKYGAKALRKLEAGRTPEDWQTRVEGMSAVVISPQGEVFIPNPVYVGGQRGYIELTPDGELTPRYRIEYLGQKRTLAEIDRAYQKAAKDGDEKAAKELLSEYAKSSGWLDRNPAWHGTLADFDVIQAPFHVGTRDAAKLAGRRTGGGIPRLIKGFIKPGKAKRVSDVEGVRGEWDVEIAKAKSEGFDSLVYENKFEDVGKDSYVLFSESQFVPADTVVKRGDKILSLKERFSPVAPPSEAQTTAAETQTPVPLRGGTGAAGVASSSLGGGRSPELPKVSPETESESSEKLDPKLIEAEQKQAKEEAAAAKKQQADEEMRSKAIDSLIGASEKKKRKFGQVTNSDAIAAVAMLVSSKDVPGVLTTWVGTKEDFLRDPANQLADPEIYARIKAGELVEGFFNKGRAYVFLDGVGVSENDMLRGEQMDVSPQIAAVRRVLLHESLVHRGIHGLPLRHRRLILNWVRQNSTPEELDDLAKLYTEYANWRDSEFQFEALAEELLAKKVDSLTEIPKDGPMAKLMDILRQIWDFIVGYKREPTLSDLKSVVKLLKSGAEALANDRLRDGGEVKLSMIAPTARITPEMDAEYLAAVEAGDMEKAQRMVDEAAKSAGFNVGPVYHGTNQPDITNFYEGWWSDQKRVTREFGDIRYTAYLSGKLAEGDELRDLFKEYEGSDIDPETDEPYFESEIGDMAMAGAGFQDFLKRKGFEGIAVWDESNRFPGMAYAVFSPEQVKSADPVTRDESGNVIPLSQRFQTTSPDIRFSRPQFSSEASAAFTAGSEAARSTLYSERDMDIREAIRRAYEAMPKTNSVAVPIGELFAKTEGLMPGVTQDEFSNVLQDLFEDNGAVLQEGESDFFVTTPEGRRAGFVVVMPSKSISVPLALRSMAMSGPSGQPINQQKYDEALAAISDFLAGKQTVQFPGKLTLSSSSGVGLRAGDSGLTQGVGEAARTAGGGTGAGIARGQPSDAQAQGAAQQGFGPYSVRNLVGEASRIGVADVRIDPESQHGAYTAVFESGEIYIVINPARMANRIAANDGDVQYAIGSILNEELIHAADMAILRDQWLNSGSKLTLTEFVKEQDVKTVREMIQVAKSSNNPLQATRILFDAITSSINLYAGNDVASLDSVEAFLNAASHDEISSVMGEFVRQMIQTGMYQTVSEKALFRKFIEKVKALARKIADVFAPAKEGRYGKLIQERLNGIEELLAYASSNTGAKASRIPIEEIQEASKPFKEDLVEASKGRDKKAAFQGNVMRGNVVPDHNVNATELYKKAANALLDSLLKNHDIIDVAKSIQDPDLQAELGMQIGGVVQPEDILNVRQYLGALLQRRLTVAISSEKKPKRLRQLELARESINAYSDGASGGGTALNNAKQVQNDPELKGDFFFSQATRKKAQKAKDKLDAITGGTEKITDIITGAEQKAAEETTQAEVEAQESAAEDDEYANLVSEGEAELTNEEKGLWERAKMLLRRFAMYAKRKGARAANAAKASLSAEQRKELDELNAIMQMSDEEAAKAESKDRAEFAAILKKLLGEEKPNDTPQQKKTRQKRVKMIDVVRRYVESGKPIDLSDQQTALKGMLREMNKARPADSVPLERAMPWRKILSSKPKDVAEYRQRILEAVSSIESFQNLTEEQKERLADLYAEAWEERRQAILDRMLRDEIKKARDRDEISDDVEKKLQQSRNKILEIINLGGFNNDDLVKILGERYGISTSFTEEQKARIQKLADQLQDEDMNTAKRNKLAMEFAVELAGAMDVPVTEIIANWWTSSVLFGPQTIFSIGAAFLNGGYSITTIGTRRMLAKLFKGDVQGSLEESILMLKGIARYLGAFKQAGRRAWNYLWSGDVGLLGIGSNDILSEISNFEQLQRFQRHKLLAEQLAKDPKMARRYVGIYLRFVSRLLTALDAFNVMVTKAGTASLALRMSGMSMENIIKAEKMLNLKAYKDQVIRDYFDNKAPTTQAEKALVDSYAEAEMYRAIDKMGGKMENADYLASESAMTMHPTGFGGVIYDAITGFFAQRQANADEYLEKMKKDWVTRKDLTSVTFLALAYLRQFAAYNAAGLTGSKFVRYASNKFNQGLSFIPFAGLLRQLEAKDDRIKGKDAFIETIYRNQVVGALMLFIGGAVLGAIEDEPDDEERGTFWNGGWANLTPDQKKQLLAKGQKEYTMGFKYNGRWYVFNYQNWPLNQMLSAIGSMSDQIRFSPKQWNEKNLLSKTVAGMVSGVKSTLEIPALSGLQELVGNRLASKDPTEQSLDRISRVASGWVGGFVPRILKDIDFATQPELRKYETLWEKTASHIPIYRRYVGEEYYDILGKPIKRNVIPGSREFMMGPTEPEYKILGALNSRNIFLTPANAEYRMVGKGRNRRRLTQEEADAYSLETGKGYRQMLLRYGQRALQMPTERARAFLSDKADEVRDRALKKVYRGYTK